jgi:hypothetical protein
LELEVQGWGLKKGKTQWFRGTTEAGEPRPGGDYTEKRGCGRRPQPWEFKSRANENGEGTKKWRG